MPSVLTEIITIVKLSCLLLLCSVIENIPLNLIFSLLPMLTKVILIWQGLVGISVPHPDIFWASCFLEVKDWIV